MARELGRVWHGARDRDQKLNELSADLGELSRLVRATLHAAQRGAGEVEAHRLSVRIAVIERRLADLRRTLARDSARGHALARQGWRFDRLFDAAAKVAAASGPAQRERRARLLLNWLQENQQPRAAARTRPTRTVPALAREAELKRDRQALRRALDEAREARGRPREVPR